MTHQQLLEKTITIVYDDLIEAISKSPQESTYDRDALLDWLQVCKDQHLGDLKAVAKDAKSGAVQE